MKARLLLAASIVLSLGMMGIGCAGTPAPGADLSPTRDQAVISVKRDNVAGSLGAWDIYIDKKQVGSVQNGQETRFLLKNGKYFMYLTAGFGQKSEVLTIAAESNVVAFTAYLSGGLHVVQSGTSTPPRTAATSLDEAIRRAGDKFIGELPGQAVIAVLNVSARNRNYSAIVVDDLEIQLVDSHQFKIVDRKQLDIIMAEQNFQMSGVVDDDSAVSIGKLLGAGVVITGSITGSGETQRLILKALDVQTAQLVSMANERF
ncbi:hypothetical protein AGMMS49944_15560 [Spirochaetia bacterium]|nr:hypothetical protein AGMMS49944_15560 [Spirochaetia bacterium]